MSFDADEEILQDFLVEAGEILELLSEQLIELENRPDDTNLLNAIFRGFHTVKGGAGFLQLDALVGCCHIAENVFDILRKGERKVDSELMDVVLQALDSVNTMFDEVRERTTPTPADPALLEALARLATPAADEPAPATHEEPEAAAPQLPMAQASEANVAEGDITDDEFEQLLDSLHGSADRASPSAASAPTATGSGDEITDDEFEALLDQLHGKDASTAAASAVASAAPSPGPAATSAAAGDEINDDEFEALLDELHGKGSAPGLAASSSPAATSAPEPEAQTSDHITDDEFEALLDQLHGDGKPPAATDAAPVEAPVQPAAASKPAAKPVAKSAAKAASPAPSKSNDAAAPPTPPSIPAVPKDKTGAVASDAPAVETTVRVDTARLDEIMNMVGELVLVRNRLVRIGVSVGDE